MWIRLLVIPEGIRYIQELGDDLEKSTKVFTSLIKRAKISFTFMYKKEPNQNDKEYKNHLINAQHELAKKNKINPVSENIFGMIRGTEPEHLDIMVKLDDVKDGREFNIKYGTDIDGTIDALENASNYRLIHSDFVNKENKIKKDPRFNKLSKEQQNEAIKRARAEDRKASDNDSNKILWWIDRLYKEKEIKKKTPEKEKLASLDDIFNEL